MKTILIVDDEQDILEIVKYNLQKEGFNVLTALNGKQALEQLHASPDLILLDVMMPVLDGIETIKQIKKNRAWEHIPVIFLTAKNSDMDEVIGFELGADDYIVKPISIPKLTARVKNVLRKNDLKENFKETDTISIGAVEIIPVAHVVKVNQKETFFPKKEFEVLLHLARHKNQVVNRDALLSSVWGTDVIVGDRTIDVHIRKIREKLGEYSDYIETIKGVGYKMHTPE